MPLLAGAASGGALLSLADAPDISVVAPVSTGVVAEVREGVRFCVVRGVAASDYDGVMDLAPGLANQALDILSMRGATHLALGDVEAFHAAWWHDDGDSRIRFVSTARAVFTASATIEVRDADGNLRPPSPEPTPTWQESMRYYRMSELTDDLFDAFRNVYLALESLLSVIEPVQLTKDGRAAEREAVWFRRALATAGTLVELGGFVHTPSADAVQEMYDELHNRVRNRVFHAKDGLRAFLPQDLLHRSQVAEARQRYSHLYLALAERVLLGRFPVGGLNLAKAATTGMLDAVTKGRDIGFTTDPTPFDSAETALSPHGHPCVTLRAREIADPRGDDYVALMASTAMADVEHVAPSVGRFGTVDQKGALGVIESLEGQLSLAGFDHCEFVISHHVIGGGRRKTRYAT
ncbi:MAG TPA: hypothetical protein VFY11_09365 [Nocardioidaceae bacterium]|nr:hypothetical protein [Nocardioidaceae bacterium]